MKFSPINANRGHAALLFAMIVPVLFGVFTLGSDGARALQDKARLNEAMEVASLAVSAQNSDDSDIRIQTASNFISYYFPLATINNVTVTKVVCEPKECNPAITERYFDYHVTASLNKKSWFPGNETTAGFGEDYNIASASSARKFQSEAIDVVYVADFSGSMKSSLPGGGESKYKLLVDIINDVNSDIYNFNLKILASSSTTPQSRVALRNPLMILIKIINLR